MSKGDFFTLNPAAAASFLNLLIQVSICRQF